MRKTFRTEIGWRAYFIVNVLIALTPILWFAASRHALSEGNVLAAKALNVGGIMILFIIPLELIVAPLIRYDVTESELVLRPGCLVILWHPGGQSRVPFTSIQSVTPTSRCIGLFGCATQGLQVDFLKRSGMKGFVRISPKNRDEFLRELERRCPHLMLSEDRLVKVSVPHYVT